MPLKLSFLAVISAILIAPAFPSSALSSPLQDNLRTIVSDDFTKSRPKARMRRKSARKSGNSSQGGSSIGRSYRLASHSFTTPKAGNTYSTESQVGLTFWKMRPARVSTAKLQLQTIDKITEPAGWIAERVEADTEFHEGEYLRLSIESPRAGYLYIIDRDWFSDGDLGETSLIFPVRGDDNRLQAGRLIDIPSPYQVPFRATPKVNQAGEILTIIVTASPLDLPISEKPLPISNARLMEWEEMWGGPTKRFEMVNGAGQARTPQEQQAARKGTRQLTRDDPPPQTIYVLSSRDRNAFLFSVKLFYRR